jgi:hypothetical protein
MNLTCVQQESKYAKPEKDFTLLRKKWNPNAGLDANLTGKCQVESQDRQKGA